MNHGSGDATALLTCARMCFRLEHRFPTRQRSLKLTWPVLSMRTAKSDNPSVDRGRTEVQKEQQLTPVVLGCQ